MKRYIRSFTEIPTKVWQAIDTMKEPKPYNCSDVSIISPAKLDHRLTFSISYFPNREEYRTRILVNDKNHGEYEGVCDTFGDAKADLASQYQKYARWAREL